MVSIGNFFFKYRNLLFILFYALLFLPAGKLFTAERFGENYYWIPILAGLSVTVLGQVIRGATIGLAYIIRGGKDGKVYAENLVTQGIFNHCRNPLYVGNILMLVGVGILSNSLFYVAIMIPLFLFIYQAIVLAEENFLRNKFGAQFDSYCEKVNRWIPDLRGIGKTFQSMRFNWKRYVLKEYNTFYVWIGGIILLLLLKYPELTAGDTEKRNRLLVVLIPLVILAYLITRYLKKSGRLTED
jgi:protein-S-isoprenylcysteine O-methyltransferase Ste14